MTSYQEMLTKMTLLQLRVERKRMVDIRDWSRLQSIDKELMSRGK